MTWYMSFHMKNIAYMGYYGCTLYKRLTLQFNLRGMLCSKYIKYTQKTCKVYIKSDTCHFVSDMGFCYLSMIYKSYLSINLSISLSIYLSSYLSIYLFIYLEYGMLRSARGKRRGRRGEEDAKNKQRNRKTNSKG